MWTRVSRFDTRAMANRRIGLFTSTLAILKRYLLIRNRLLNLDIIDCSISKPFKWNNLIQYKYSKWIILPKLTNLYRWNNPWKRNHNKSNWSIRDKNYQNWTLTTIHHDLVNLYQKDRKRNFREIITIQST